MDREHRHRAILSVAGLGGLALVAGMGNLHAQTPAPVVTATPWVQASPPPGASPVKAAPTAVPTASPNHEELARAMAHRREEELAKQQAELAKQKPTPAPSKPPHAPPQLSPEEHAAYERNLTVWQGMPPEEKAALRSLAAERVQEEIEKAYESSGLNLNPDQREVFELRYRQERRRLERELQEKARVERARRTPEIMERLKREFAFAAPAANNAPKPTPKATPAPSPAPSPAPR